MTREERLRKPLSYEDAMAIKEQCPSAETVSVELFPEMGEFGLPPVTARYKGQDMVDALFVGVTAEHLRLLNATLGEGRFFTEVEDLHRRDIAVIGDGVRERFFAARGSYRQDDSGGRAQPGSHRHPHQIQVVPRRRPERQGYSHPVQQLQENLSRSQGQLHLCAGQQGKMEEAKDEVTELLRRRRHVKPADPDNFGISSAESVIGQFRQIISTVALVMVVISSIGLLVGGIGVMNIMLVSVTERTREIGVRKAIGARRSDITWQFLLEAMTLTASGGLIGILIGWLLSVTIRTLVPSLPSTVPLWSVITGFVVATSIGLFFGMWPAVKAARLDPIAALRHE